MLKRTPFLLVSFLANFGMSSFTHAADYSLPKRNSFLAAETLAITHIDPAATDSLPYAIPKGTFHVDLNKTPHVPGGPVCIMTLKSISDDFMWSVSTGGVAYVDKAGDNWKEVARLDIPGMAVLHPKNKEALGKKFESILK